VVARHAFPYMHDQATMNAIFGKMKHDELFSPRNRLIISKEVEGYFDSGRIVIVPDLSPKPRSWLGREASLDDTKLRSSI
jgi:hypothetical protein